MKSPVTRRTFLRSTGLATAGALAFPAILRSQPAGALAPINRLNIACIGVGGRGRQVIAGLAAENFVAFADVDDERAAETYQKYPDVPRYRDYRQLLDRHAHGIDAVAIATPDHMHFPIAVAALQLGKHVFLEKPMTHTIAEARQLAQLAGEKKVATQMGNQGHANEGPRLLKEWYDGGVLGEVREVHSWTNRPIWPQGVGAPDHSKLIPVTPATFDWDLWLGVAAARPYDPAYAPFKWRGHWDFGTGALGDMGCHIMDGAFWALGLGAPTRIEAVSAPPTPVSPPSTAMVTYHFPARDGRPGLKWTWYEGGLQPTLPVEWEAGRAFPTNGTLVVGSKTMVLADTYYSSVRLVPEARMRELVPSLPAKSLPRIAGGHFAEWLRACKGGEAAGSNFEYAAKLTELCLLSNVAVRARRAIDWDVAAMRVTNVADANQFLAKAYRPGFGV